MGAYLTPLSGGNVRSTQLDRVVELKVDSFGGRSPSGQLRVNYRHEVQGKTLLNC
jgi:hypothetical protein